MTFTSTICQTDHELNMGARPFYNTDRPMTLRTLALPFLLSLALWGCGGGGGGGGASPGAVRYTTSWGTSSTLTASSQGITLTKPSGEITSSVVLNRGGADLQAIDLGPVPPGVYRLTAEVFSGLDKSGARTGQLAGEVVVNGDVPFTTAVTGVVASVQVDPASATLNIPETKQFFARALDSQGRSLFQGSNAFSWQQLGGVVTINSSGLAQAQAAGTGSVRATHNSSLKSGSSAVTVTNQGPRQGKWTVMVFMNAANDLYPYSALNMNQMETVAQNPDVRFVVQWKQTQDVYPGSSFDGTRRYLVTPDSSNAIASTLVQDMGGGVDMGSPQTLRQFMAWARQFYPADRYVLVVWNHGNGWRRSIQEEITRAVSYDDEFGTSIQIWELPGTLSSQPVDILAWDASLMQMQEVAYEVSGNAGLIVGSEESPPGEGYPYQLIFDDFRDNPDAPATTLARAFVDGMLAVPEYSTRKITQSVLDTSKLAAVSTALDALAQELIANKDALATAVQTVRQESQSYSPTTNRFYRDAWDLADRLSKETSIASVKTACAGLKAAVEDAVIYEGHNAHSPGSHGLAVDFSPAERFTASALDYAVLKLARDTKWNEWLAQAP